MRNALLLGLLVAAGLSGCLSGDDDGPETTMPRLAASDITVPDGAQLSAIPGGFAARWAEASLPFEAQVTVPPHATMVRLVSEDAGTGLSIVHSETGRRRCNNPTVESFSDVFGAPRSCSGLTALDPPGTVWTARAFGSGNAELRVEYLDTAPDGIVGLLELSLIDPPTHELLPTEVLSVPSFDGALLRVEVTLPAGDGPWPAIIESSPYHDDGVRAEPASWAYFVQDWAKRGYAVVVADVRGFGDSGGCVEVWGPNEQADQKFLVEWTAEQRWSDGNVGFYGQSYVGTTPVEAAVQAPEALKAIIAVAPVINAYNDWHYGGVPNGENLLSPVAYQALQDASVNYLLAGQAPPVRNDPMTLATTSSNGLCDPTLTARANDPRALYDAFYEERDFSLRAGDITAAVLYTEGFEDANVKSAMIPGWFNEITAPKLGLFGHWLHQHPSRMDTEALMVGWMEQYVKGKDLGFGSLPTVDVAVDRETHRTADAWPPLAPVETSFHVGPDGLTTEAGSGPSTVDLAPAGASPLGGPTSLTFEGMAPAAFSLAGEGRLHVVGTLEGGPNAYLAAELWADEGDGARLWTWGEFNIAHRDGHDQYVPVTPGEVVSFDLPLRPTEHLFAEGAALRLVVRGVGAAEATDVGGITGLRFTLESGEEGTRLVLPGVAVSEYEPIPLTARP